MKFHKWKLLRIFDGLTYVNYQCGEMFFLSEQLQQLSYLWQDIAGAESLVLQWVWHEMKGYYYLKVRICKNIRSNRRAFLPQSLWLIKPHQSHEFHCHLLLRVNVTVKADHLRSHKYAAELSSHRDLAWMKWDLTWNEAWVCLVCQRRTADAPTDMKSVLAEGDLIKDQPP